MSDADLIYNACLRAERRMEKAQLDLHHDGKAAQASFARLVMTAVSLIREEIGNGLAKDAP